jgi:hypothetical protein
MARIKGPRKIHRYTAEFKVKAVKLSELKEVREGRLRARVAVAPQARERGRVEQLSALKRQRRPRIRSGRSLCSLGSPLNAYPLGRSRR